MRSLTATTGVLTALVVTVLSLTSIAALMTVVEAVTPGYHCIEHSTCSGCVNAENNNCGWCRSTGTCSHGTHSGPAGGTCAGTWAWRIGECGTCSQISSCYDCTITGGTGNDGCGWCSTGLCMDGTFSGPSGGPVCSGQWQWKPQDCMDCNKYSSCSTCVSSALDKECGWCATTETCSLGDKSAPKHGVCPGPQTQWAWKTCPADLHSCNSHLDCRSCVTGAWSQSHCGWCASSGTCELGTISGPSPYMPTCATNQWTFNNECPTAVPPTPYPPVPPTPPPTPSPDPCNQFATCTPCTSSNLGVCGWCYDPFVKAGICQSGSDYGPTSGSCLGRWDWYASSQCSHDADTPGCSQFTSCKDCTGDRTRGECGWCGTTHTCVAGGKTGPTSATCSGTWYHLSTGNQCISEQCAGYGTCTECTLSTSGQCGYCYNYFHGTGTCMQGNYNGSTGQNGQCLGEWDWYSSKCPTPAPFGGVVAGEEENDKELEGKEKLE